MNQIVTNCFSNMRIWIIFSISVLHLLCIFSYYIVLNFLNHKYFFLFSHGKNVTIVQYTVILTNRFFPIETKLHYISSSLLLLIYWHDICNGLWDKWKLWGTEYWSNFFIITHKFCLHMCYENNEKRNFCKILVWMQCNKVRVLW